MGRRPDLRVVSDQLPTERAVPQLPTRSLFGPPATRSAEERACLDEEYALLRHRSRRRFKWLTLLPHACVALIVWSIPDVAFLLACALATSLATHVLIALNDRRPRHHD